MHDSEKSFYNSVFDIKFKWRNKSRHFGEMVLVTLVKKIQEKLRNHVMVCMFVAYPQNHLDDVTAYLISI
jgi:hypothetical protein